MSEPSRNSLKLDIAGSGVRSGDSELREIYKSIPEDDRIADSRNDLSENKKSPKMVHNGESVQDGADEKMLKDEEKMNLAKTNEVQFISGNQNGDAKIDIGAVERTFSGMTKDELMKYANDPFWVRLRWIFFICFWALWAAMLVGAILIIINAPKCAAPTPLVWWKQGPLVKFQSSEYTKGDEDQAIKLKAKGVIYELPGAHTYTVHNADVENKIKNLVDHYNKNDIFVILDLTPNYVTNESDFFQDALARKTPRSSFVWVEQTAKPNNWVAKPPLKRSAWQSVSPDNWVLSTFNDGLYDLQMDDPIVERELRRTLEHLVQLGVKGFRLANAKHFIVSKTMKNEEISGKAGYENDWEFWTHKETILQDGLGALLHTFTLIVRNATNGEGFLSVTEDIVRPEVFETDYGHFGIDLPIYRRLPYIAAAQPQAINNTLNDIFEFLGRQNGTWLQWNYDMDKLVSLHPSAYNIFLMLLPGVPVQSANSILLTNVSESSISQLVNLRQSPSYMHGSFAIYNTGELIAYSSARIKSGNPGFFVVLNPTGTNAIGNFTQDGLPDKMTFDLLSDNYNITGIATKSKIPTEAIPISKYSAAVLTYVPVKN